MKTFTSIFMVLVIIAGFILAVTPFIADKFFPAPEKITRQAKPEAAANALKQWFDSPNALITDVQAANKTTQDKRISWFSFSVGRRPVENFIINKKLKQISLTADKLKSVFYLDKSPASWWQPDAIKQQTFFTGKDHGVQVSLIYNPDSKRGVLVTESK